MPSEELKRAKEKKKKCNGFELGQDHVSGENPACEHFWRQIRMRGSMKEETAGAGAPIKETTNNG